MQKNNSWPSDNKKPRKAILLLFAAILMTSAVFAVPDAGRIYAPSNGVTVGKSLTVDFNVSDDVNQFYTVKGLGIWIAINDVNVLTDYNIVTGLANGQCSDSNILNPNDHNRGQVRCSFQVTTAKEAIKEGSATLKVYAYNTTVDSNTSETFIIEKSYSIISDDDVNKYEQSDIQDLTESGFGELLKRLILIAGIVITGIVLVYGYIRIKKA